MTDSARGIPETPTSSVRPESTGDPRNSGVPELAARIDTLAERMGRVERAVGLEWVADAASSEAPAKPEIAAEDATQTPPMRVTAPIAPSPAEASRDEANELKMKALRRLASVPTPESSLNKSSPSSAPIAQATAAAYEGNASNAAQAAARDVWHEAQMPGNENEERSAFSVESLIGGRLFAGIGALAIVIGVGLFLKFAYDEGWFGRVPPLGKCAMAGMFGFALLIAGEWARQKINAMASAGLSAAGVGALYATAYAAHSQWELVTSGGAMALLIMTCVIGIAVGARAGLVSVAGLSLIGGYVTPLVIGAQADASPIFLPVYLTALFVVALALSGWVGRRNPMFHSLRLIAWIGTGGMGTMWLLMTGVKHEPAAALVFLGAVWALTHFERITSIRGLWFAREDADTGEREKAWWESEALKTPFRQGRAIMGSFSATAWAAAFGAWTLVEGMGAESWYAPAALVGPTAFVGLMLGGHLRGMRDVPQTEAERFGVALLVQSAALVIVTMALALSGWTLIVAWLALGVASIAAGRWMNSRALDAYGLIVMLLATVRLMLLLAVVNSGAGGALAGAGINVFGLYLDLISARIAVTALAWLIAGGLLLIREQERKPALAIAAAHLGMWMVALLALRDRSEAASICIAWVGLAAACFGAQRLVPRLAPWGSGSALLILSMVVWVIAFPPMNWNGFSQPIGLHPGLWAAILIGAVGCVAAKWLAPSERGSQEQKFLVAMSVIVATGLFFLASSLEVSRAATLFAAQDRARLAAVSIYWGLFAVGLLGAGFVRAIPGVRYAGLALMSVAAIKVVLVDLSSAPPMWRIVSFIGLGLLMVGVALAYAKVAKGMEVRGAPAGAAAEA